MRPPRHDPPPAQPAPLPLANPLPTNPLRALHPASCCTGLPPNPRAGSLHCPLSDIVTPLQSSHSAATHKSCQSHRAGRAWCQHLCPTASAACLRLRRWDQGAPRLERAPPATHRVARASAPGGQVAPPRVRSSGLLLDPARWRQEWHRDQPQWQRGSAATRHCAARQWMLPPPARRRGRRAPCPS